MKRKITDEQVKEIKNLLCNGITQQKIAKKFNISRSLVSDIATGRAHPDVGAYIGKQYKPLPTHDPTDAKILALEAEVAHLKDERLYLKKQLKSAFKDHGLLAVVKDELNEFIKPYPALPNVYKIPEQGQIVEDLVMHLSDTHRDQIVVPEECGGLENHNFLISMRRAEIHVDTILKWTQKTLASSIKFPTLTILSYGDHTSGEIHGNVSRSYFRNIFKNCFAIGQLHGLMVRDLAPYFETVNVFSVPGNHGRRSQKKDYHGAHNNWDYLIAEITKLHCKELTNVHFVTPNSFSVNLAINDIGFCIFHGDDIQSNLGIPWYGLQRKEQKILALNSLTDKIRIRYNCCGHFHRPSSISDLDGELIINGAGVATDSYIYNKFGGYTIPKQLLHGVNSKYGITWRLPIHLRTQDEHKGPRRYKISNAEDILVP